MSTDAIAAAATPAAEVHRDEYDRLDRLNFSRLKLLEKSPAHYRLGRGDDSDSLKLGTAIHMAILEPARFAAEYEITSVRRDSRTKVWQETEAAAIRNGKTLVTPSEHGRITAVRDAVLANRRAVHYLTGGKPEVTLQWDVGPFKCKGRADYIGEAIVDLKSTQCASPKAFGHSVRKYGYLMQAAWYHDGQALTSGKEKPFVFIAVESAPPHIVQVYTVSPEQLEKGREQYLTLLAKLDYCQRTNWWGGYTESEEIELELPQASGWSEEQ